VRVFFERAGLNAVPKLVLIEWLVGEEKPYNRALNCGNRISE